MPPSTIYPNPTTPLRFGGSVVTTDICTNLCTGGYPRPSALWIQRFYQDLCGESSPSDSGSRHRKDESPGATQTAGEERQALTPLLSWGFAAFNCPTGMSVGPTLIERFCTDFRPYAPTFAPFFALTGCCGGGCVPTAEWAEAAACAALPGLGHALSCRLMAFPGAQPMEVNVIAPDGTVSIDDAVRLCGVSDETIRRRLRADQLPGAFRHGTAGVWRIPVAALVSAGFEIEFSGVGNDEQLAELEARLSVADAVAQERLARIEQLERHIDDLRAVLRVLEAAR